jgi:hypothetical protein
MIPELFFSSQEFGIFQRAGLCFEIDLCINLRCVELYMAQPGADRIQINTYAQ